jgi:pyruvate formate lyase activating enzyme
VLRTLQNVCQTDTHLEIVNLVIPGKNDNLDDLRSMCVWIAENLGPQTPLHFTRFFPSYKFQRLPLTPIETLEAAAQIATEAGLQYVYIGNLPGHEKNSTFCPNCGEVIIKRVHFSVQATHVVDGN